MRSDVPGAHARLASIDPTATGPSLLPEILEALAKAAGVSRGVLLDSSGRSRPVAFGLNPDAAVLSGLMSPVPVRRGEKPLLPPALVSRLFECGPAGSDGVSPAAPDGPRAIPLTAGDETLALAILERPPEDPAAFASVVAHAASLLALVRMSEKVREADFELKYRVWELESLYDIGLSIAGTLDMDSLADDILLKSVSLLNARNGALVVRRELGDDELLVKNFGPPLVESLSLEDLSGGTIVANRREDRSRALANAPAEKLLAVPIISDGTTLGLLVVADKENRAGGIDDFGPADERILSLFANQAAIALENARLHREAVEKEKMEREIEIAASIQRTILPSSLPPVPGVAISAGNRPTRQVGGDFFDVYPLPDGRAAFCVADVSGKGIPAALLVSTVHAGLHLLIEGGVPDLPRLVGRLNLYLTRFSATRKFVTLFVGILDPKSGELRYVNAGHNPGLWLSAEEVTLLPSTGLPIGIFPQATFGEACVKTRPGDVILLYSDGITEAANAADEEFGMERLTALLVEGRDAEPADLKDRIFAEVATFTRGVAQYDDQTVLVARTAPSAA